MQRTGPSLFPARTHILRRQCLPGAPTFPPPPDLRARPVPRPLCPALPLCPHLRRKCPNSDALTVFCVASVTGVYFWGWWGGLVAGNEFIASEVGSRAVTT